ncbi:MAG: hypothetical protein M0Z31_06865 [Clostridia bacterium]|nr:hypothetical protein [Clostridia bacterium]
MVWEDGRNFKGDRGLRAGENVPENNTDIYLYDIKEEKEMPIATGSLQESEPFVSGHYVVWTDRNNGTSFGDIFLYDLRTGKKRQITKDRFNQSSPKIYGDFIVWMDERRGIASSDVFINGKAPNADIFMYNLKTNTERFMTGDEVQLEPNISDNWLVFTLSRDVEPKIQAVRYDEEGF